VAIALRSSTTVASTTRTNTTVTAPAGAVTGSDVIVVFIDVNGSSLRTITTPSGWTVVGPVQYSNPDPYYVNMYMFYRVHDGASSWTFNHTSAISDALCEAWSGVDTTTPLDTTSATNGYIGSNNAGNGTATVNSITIATVGARELICRGAWDGTPITPPAGWTERIDQFALWVGDKTASVTGATGSMTMDSGNTVPYAGGLGPWGTIHAALRPAASFDGTTSGSISIVSATTGAPTGLAPVTGSAPVASVATGAPAARLGVAGTVAVTSTATGTANMLEPTAGTVAVISTASGTPTTRAVAAGTIPIVSTVTGAANLGGGALAASGTVTVTSAATGAPTLRAPAAGTVAVVSAATGITNTLEPTSGTVAVTLAVSGAPTALAVAAGSIPIVSTVTGAANVQAGGSLATSGTVTITTASSGSTGQRHASTATVAVVSAVSGVAGRQQAVTALVAIVSGTSGAAGRTIPLAGVVVIVSTASGSPQEGGWVGPIVPRVLVGFLRDDGHYVGRLQDNSRYEAKVR
jgi:hypothetical protein